MADTILETLEEDMNAAFREFAARPTQSGRINLRHRLLTIAGALEVEAYNLPDAEAIPLNNAIGELKALAEVALIAPKESLIMQQDTPVPVKEPEKPAVQAAQIPRWGIYLVAKVITDIAKLFRR